VASGTAVSDGNVKVSDDTKVHKSLMSEEVKKWEKMVLFCLSGDKKNIILERLNISSYFSFYILGSFFY
uniref:Uncharacterized protein n=1 Tax=Prolemur simus TaxID=1328070 RepID=A0A8C8ZLN7_PROSS